MPALLLPLLLIATTPAREETVPLHNATIREWGVMPGFASGIFMAVRKLVIATANGDVRILYRVHLDASDETPPAGSICEIRYSHRRYMNGHAGEGGIIQEGDLVTDLNCRAP